MPAESPEVETVIRLRERARLRVGQYGDGLAHGVEVEQWLAHSHVHDVVEPTDRVLEMVELPDDLGGVEVARVPDVAGLAKGAAHRAPDLAGDARGLSPLPVHEEDGLDGVPVGEAHLQLNRPVRVLDRVEDARREYGERGLERRPEREGKV
jgi:hypothetical protein